MPKQPSTETQLARLKEKVEKARIILSSIELMELSANYPEKMKNEIKQFLES